jgi:hypothetical protein
LFLALSGIGYAQTSDPGTDSPIAPTAVDTNSPLPPTPVSATNSLIAPTPVRLKTNLPEATTEAAPAAGLNPLTMSASDFAAWGYPPQPDQCAQPQAYAAWVQAMTAAQTRIIPSLARTIKAYVV